MYVWHSHTFGFHVTIIEISTRLIPPIVCLLQACAKKRLKKEPNVLYAVNDVVAELHIPTNPSDTSFEHFLQHNRDEIVHVVGEHVEHYGSVSCTNVNPPHANFFSSIAVFLSSVCLSAMLYIATTKASEHVNRKCCPTNIHSS